MEDTVKKIAGVVFSVTTGIAGSIVTWYYADEINKDLKIKALEKEIERLRKLSPLHQKTTVCVHHHRKPERIPSRPCDRKDSDRQQSQ